MSYYIKQRDIETMSIPKAASWVVRKILDRKDDIMGVQMIQGNLISRLKVFCKLEQFNIQKLYLALVPTYSKVAWKNLILLAHAQPRHRFTVWLAAQQRLPTVDKLQKFGIIVPGNCVFCDQNTETFNHMFFDCPVPKGLWNRICFWLGHHRTVGDWETELQWVCCKAKSRVVLNSITACTFINSVALIWQERNNIRFNRAKYQESQLCREIALSIHIRGRNCRRWRVGLDKINKFP